MTEYTYYGRVDPVPLKVMQEKGVHLYMLDQHISSIVDNHIARFQREISEMITAFKKEAFAEVKLLRKDMFTLKIKMKSLSKSKVDSEEKEMEEVIAAVKSKKKKGDIYG